MKRVVELDLSVVAQDVQTSPAAPAPGAASMVVPELQFGFGARRALGYGFSIGLHFDLALSAFAAPNYTSTPVSDSGGVWTITAGPDLAVAGTFAQSVIGWGLFASVSPAIGFVLIEEVGGETTSWGSLGLFYRGGLALHFFSEEAVSGQLGVAIQNYVIGDAQGHRSFDQHGVVPFVGVRAVSDVGLYGFAQVHFPLGFEYTRASPLSGVLGMGMALGREVEP